MRTVDVSYKLQTLREAVAYGKIRLSKECIKKIKDKELPKVIVLKPPNWRGYMGQKTPLCFYLFVIQ